MWLDTAFGVSCGRLGPGVPFLGIGRETIYTSQMYEVTSSLGHIKQSDFPASGECCVEDL